MARNGGLTLSENPIGQRGFECGTHERFRSGNRELFWKSRSTETGNPRGSEGNSKPVSGGAPRIWGTAICSRPLECERFPCTEFQTTMTTQPALRNTAGLILAETADLRASLLTHPIYDCIRDVASLKLFMQHHVFAVLDFMWLLKRLQNDLCCTRVPWLPVADPNLARFVNEIVLGEETDEDGRGGHCSHFELYLQAMDDVRADRSQISRFETMLRRGRDDVRSMLTEIGVPASVAQFVEFTHRIATSATSAEVACVFCFGREDIIPDMFQRLLHAFEAADMEVPRLAYYIRRHIELDGDHHGPLTRRMVELLCNSPAATAAAIQAARDAISFRIQLWDGVVEELKRVSV